MQGLIVLAQGAAAGAERPNWLIGGMPIFLLLIMMFFLFRSQKKQANQRKEMITRIKAGDEVVTNGGIKGTVTKVKDKSFMVKIAEKVEIEIVASGIGAVVQTEKVNE